MEEQDMTRTLISRAMRIGRATVLAVGLAVVLAATLGITTTALAAVPGDPFKLGQLNAVNRVSKLVGSAKGMLLRVDNNGGGPALFLEANAGRPPLVVNASAGKAKNLNADKLDGKDSSAFLAADGKAADAAHADRADSAARADVATNASDAANADTLDGRNSSDFAPGSAEAWHEVGASGEPGFQSGFSNYRSAHTANWSTAAFYKDPYGVVHLKGTVKSGSDIMGGSPIFTLPSGYRPSAIERHAVFKNIGVFSEQVVFVDINPDGRVSVGGGRYDNGLSLDGITFRTAGQ
jgi:hypothetical protein